MLRHTLGSCSCQLNPKKNYFLLHSAPAWDTLDLIWGINPVRRAKTAKVINQIFDLACSNIADPSAKVMDCSDLSFPDPGLGNPLSSVWTSLLLENGKPTAKRTKSNWTMCLAALPRDCVVWASVLTGPFQVPLLAGCKGTPRSRLKNLDD